MAKRVTIQTELTTEELHDRYRSATTAVERTHWQIVWLMKEVCWLHGISVPKMGVFAFHFCDFSKLWHAPVKGCKSISCVSIHDAEVDAVHPHFQ